MKITVVNGSPKGSLSATVHSLFYLERLHEDIEFTYLDAGQRIKGYLKDFSEVKKTLESSDMIIFSYPVYTFIAPSQLHYFISLLKEHGVSLKGKFCTQITTSKHFYDITAHKYIEDNASDLGMKYIRGLSADMDDLLCEKGQKELADWFSMVRWSYDNDIYERKIRKESSYVQHFASDRDKRKGEKKGDIVIVADVASPDEPLMAMVRRFQAASDRNTRVIKLKDIPLRGGCLGCFNCAVSAKCVYTDGYDSFLRTEIQSAECIVYAFSIKDHSMGPRFKMFDDRQFCNGHRTVTMGSPVGYIISGPYSEEANLQTILEARAEVGGNVLAGIVSDESNPDRGLDELAMSISYILDNKVSRPQNFYGVGGMKIFRDLIYTMRGMMKADHKFFKEHGQYDFPQKKKGTILRMYLVGALLSNPKIMQKAGSAMTEGMVGPYKKVIKELEEKKKENALEVRSSMIH